MHQFKVSREIEVALEQVWCLLDDFASTWVFHLGVRRSDSVNGKPTGLGAQRECTLYAGPKIQERIVTYNAERHG